MKNHFRAGFTLNELLIVMAIFVIMSTISLPYLGNFYRDQSSSTYCKGIRQALYRASYRAYAGEQNSNWGVHMESDSYTLFAGDSYSTRLTQFDETYYLPSTMIIGLSDVLFSKNSGKPNATGIVSIVFNGATAICAEVTDTGLIDS